MRRTWLALLTPLVLAPAAGRAADVSKDEARLAAAWQALHKGQPLPAPCPHPDPLRQVTAELDASVPGRETALASLRLGVVLLSEKGQPLAAYELGCGEANATGPDPRLFSDAAPTGRGAPAAPGPQVLELHALKASGLGPADLLLRTQEVGRCARITWWQLLHRHETTLQSIFATEERVERACGAAPYEKYSAQIEVASVGVLRVMLSGTVRKPRDRGEHGPAEALHETTLYQLQPSGRFAPAAP